MKTLVVEDDFTSRTLLQKILASYGECDIAVNGDEAIKAFCFAMEQKIPYDLICLDIMMPMLDGQQALKAIREVEKEKRIKGPDEVKVIMTTALEDPKTVIESYYKGGATSYLVKPLDRKKLMTEIRKLGLIK